MYIGIDLGGSHVSIGQVCPSGRVLNSIELRTIDYPSVPKFISGLQQAIEQLKIKNSKNSTIEAIGIGAPNGNVNSGCIEYAPNLPWKGVVPLVQLLQEALGQKELHITLSNDANAAAMGEFHFGIAQKEKIRDFVMITLGTGLGSGVVVDGRLVSGHDGFAGELGHWLLYPQGRLCGCGRQGCLERYVSATGLVLSAKESLVSKPKTILSEFPIEKLSALDIFEAAQKADALALQLFDEMAQQLASVLVNVTTLTSPQAFIFFGGVANAGEVLLQPLRLYFEQNIAPVYRQKVKLLSSALPENHAAILGAAALAISGR